MSIDPYTDPATGVLRNRFGIIDPQRLAEAEAGVTLVAIAELGVRILPGSYDLRHLQEFHRVIFGELYEWAGELRTVGIAKTDPFCLPQHIESYSTGVFAELARENFLRGLSRGAFLDRLTYFFAEINAIHPFREGNGRTQRAFFHQLSREAGWPVDWSLLDPAVNNKACAASLRGDNHLLRALLDSLVAQP